MSETTLETPKPGEGAPSGADVPGEGEGIEGEGEEITFKEIEEGTGVEIPGGTEAKEQTGLQAYPKVPCRKVNTNKCAAHDYGLPDAAKGVPEKAKTCPFLKNYACPYLYKAPAGGESPETAEAIKELQKKTDKEKEALQGQIDELVDDKKERDAETETTKLLQAGRIGPKQKDLVVKLFTARPELIPNFTSIFDMQKLVPIGEEKGEQVSEKEGDELSEEDRARIRREQGLDQLREERGVKKKGGK